MYFAIALLKAQKLQRWLGFNKLCKANEKNKKRRGIIFYMKNKIYCIQLKNIVFYSRFCDDLYLVAWANSYLLYLLMQTICPGMLTCSNFHCVFPQAKLSNPPPPHPNSSPPLLPSTQQWEAHLSPLELCWLVPWREDQVERSSFTGMNPRPFLIHHSARAAPSPTTWH